MSYTCYATGEFVQGIKSNLVPTKLRKVNYNNYLVYQKGNKIIKQFTGSTSGLEVVEEKPVSLPAYNDFIVNHNPPIVDEKTINNEFTKRRISAELYNKASTTNNIITINELPEKEENTNNYSEYYNDDE